jgi:hypothetical protein
MYTEVYVCMNVVCNMYVCTVLPKCMYVYMYACVRKYIFLRLYYVNMYVLDSITKFYTEIRIKHLHIKTACFPPLPRRAGVELRTQLSQAPSMDADGNLVMPLRDSAFHRLLLHGVCQFYCLKSKVPIPIYLPYLLRGCAWSYVRVCMYECIHACIFSLNTDNKVSMPIIP